MLPPVVLASLWPLLCRVEAEGAWPRAAVQARVVLLAKGQAQIAPSASDLRPITLLSALFRGWGSIRRSYLSGWARSWALDCQAGIAGGPSVERLTWDLGAAIEQGRRLGGGVVGVSFDLSKAFDGVCRELAYTLAAHAGLDPGVLRAVQGLYEHLERVFQLPH